MNQHTKSFKLSIVAGEASGGNFFPGHFCSFLGRKQYYLENELNHFVKQYICNTTQNDAFFMLNMNNFMSSLDGSVEVELGTNHFK